MDEIGEVNLSDIESDIVPRGELMSKDIKMKRNNGSNESDGDSSESDNAPMDYGDG